MRRHRAPTLLFFLLALRPVPASAQVPDLVFERTIGCDMCDGPEQFREIQSLFVEGRRVVATDGDAPHVRVFPLDATAGGAVRSYGPEGDGPGELRTPLTAILGRTGTITVVDLRQKRVTEFDSAGEVTATLPFNAFPAGAGYARDVERLLLTVTDFKGGQALVRLQGTGLDTVLAQVPFEDDGVMRLTSPAVRDDGAFAFGEGSEEYLVHVYGPDGRLRHTLRRDVERRPRTAEEIEEIAAARSRRMMASGARRRASEGGAGRGAPEIDPVQPHFQHFSALQFDGRERLWVRTSRALPGRTIFDVFGADLQYLGEVGVDRPVAIYSVRDGWLVGVTPGELDIPRIGVWRVVD